MSAQEDMVAAAEIRKPSIVSVTMDEKARFADIGTSCNLSSDEDLLEPTQEELQTLRRVSGKIPWTAMTVTFVEFAERFSYYGTTAVFVNFLQQPRPYGSRTGSIQETEACYSVMGMQACAQPGGLGQGQQTSFAFTTLNQFWAYLMPLVGGYIADTYLGRYMTIQYSIVAALIGHTILVCSSIPSVMDHPQGALGCFAIGLILMGVGTGGFKSNISPLLAEQIQETRPVVMTLKSGERVIRDPQVTYSRIFLYFYMMINLGSLSGGIGMVYAERFVGFWLSFALPTFIFFFAPLVLLACKKKYILSPPTGSVASKAFRLFSLAIKNRKSNKGVGFWEGVKPSRLGHHAPEWMAQIDDVWVDQVARGFDACKVFCWMPLYWLAYNQMVNNLTSQSATMQLNGVPNDLINNLNPITLVIFIPLFDYIVYPTLRRWHVPITPIKRIACGFVLASLAMVSACVVQYYIYQLSPCPAAEVSTGKDCEAPINVWVQAVPYCLVAFSEIGASISTLEYAFTKAPENMRGLVMGVNLLQNAFSAALGQALLPLATDPLLIWNYGVVALVAFAGGVGFWFTWRNLDSREDELNMIQKSTFRGKESAGTLIDEEQ
ncbi:peptide transporter PTR2-A [Acrodontium crateriforme]|uniref:Peptide transporter PTR2-A n=1 Tax=Acrodontium crateriforme TaxID=150365 RepID=A0AAQ3M2S1_9PEZI|nr:peptide transporter PTR2-A [Acrodontium crateriforme]